MVFYVGPFGGFGDMVLARPAETLSLIWTSPLLRWICASKTFPLSTDHLIPLVQYNLIRAALTNMWILSRFHTLPKEHEGLWGHIPLFPPPLTIPNTLVPTELQMQTPHDLWIDLLPEPAMRDNVIRAASTLNAKDLCLDLLGRMCHGENSAEMTGILAWRDPWTSKGWEITEGFAKKWGFLLEGCENMLHATNEWRGQRGEEPLFVNI